MNKQNDGLLTFGGHLEVFRQMLFRILGVAAVIAKEIMGTDSVLISK